jgi:polar amino acid transport system permease protein
VSSESLRRAVEAEDQRRTSAWNQRYRVTSILLLTAVAAFIVVYLNIEFEFLARVTPFIIGGSIMTIVVSLCSIVLATVLALLGAVGRLSNNAMANAIASFYVSFFRGTPLLLQLLFWYLALPQVGLVFDPIVCAIGALGMNYGAYMTEIFRAGIQAVPTGQKEAAAALGMSERTAFRRIVAPQAFKIILPAIGNDFIAMLKDSALASAVTLQEILWRAQNAGRKEFKSLQTLLIAAALYWIMTIVFSSIQQRLERRMSSGDRIKEGTR